jgi:DNA polymerase epsilon subunit 1
MELADMAINAVLQSALVNEMEGSGAGSMAFGNASHNLDEYAQGTANASIMLGDAVLSIRTFSVLKNLVRSWFLNKARAHIRGDTSSPANLVVDQFWRWISSNASCMFEPALQRFLHSLMKKTLLQLLAEFKRLGTQVVYADLNRVFLLTSKPDAGSAYAFAKYLVSAANSHDLFRHIVIDVTHFWNHLSWMDVANFGGVRVTPEEALLPPNKAFEISMDWNIQAYLPGELQLMFERTVADFIYALYTAQRNSLDGRGPLRPVYNLNVEAPGEAPTTQANPAKDKERAAASKAISTTLTRKLLEDVTKIRRQQVAAQANHDTTLLAFPALPGSRLREPNGKAPSNPPLEFVKTVCEVFSLATDLQIDVQIMRRNLLDLIGVREFAPEAAFRNSGESLIVPLVSCARCNAIRDVDLGRDPDCLPSIDPATGELQPPPRSSWACHKCNAEYDRFAIEHPLIDMVSRTVTAWQTQDVICLKCSESKSDNLAATCRCGGSFRPALNRNDTTARLKMIQSVATYHKLATTGEYVSDVLSRW